MKYECILCQSLGILCATVDGQPSSHVLHSTEMNSRQNIRAAACFTQLPHLSTISKAASRQARGAYQEEPLELYDAVASQLACIKPPEITPKKKHVTFCPFIFERMITPESSNDLLQFIDTRPVIKEFSPKKESEKQPLKKSRKKVAASPPTHVKEPRSKEGLRPTHKQNKEIISLIEKVSFTSCDLANRKERLQTLRPSTPLKRQMIHDKYGAGFEPNRSRSRLRERSPNHPEASSDFEIHRDGGKGQQQARRKQLRRTSVSPEMKRSMPKSRSSRTFAVAKT